MVLKYTFVSHACTKNDSNGEIKELFNRVV